MGLLVERHDDLIVGEIRDLVDGLGGLPRHVDALVTQEADRLLVDPPAIEAGAAEDELGLVQ